MSYKWYIYSLDDNIKISDLKKSNYPSDINTDKITKYISANNIHIYCEDENYHYKFNHISSKPYIVYAMGNLDLLDMDILSIVWPRKASEYGKQVVCQLIKLLSSKKVCTISGLADGIDELVHLESVKNNIPTIAVLGGGLWYFLGGNKKWLIDKILNSWGLILSEFRIKQKPAPYTFPQRNRIVAGLSNMLFLPEASENSGSLITAKFALSMWKSVYITPNNIYNTNSYGSNKLLNENGVFPVWDLQYRVDEHFDDVQNADKSEYIYSINNRDDLTLLQSKILWYISEWFVDIETILWKDEELDYQSLLWELSMLEIDGYIYTIMPWKFAIK